MSEMVMVAIRPEDLKNFELFMRLREDEREAMEYFLKNFSLSELEVLNDSLENLRVMKRAGHFAFWVVGFIGAGMAAAAYVKGWFWK